MKKQIDSKEIGKKPSKTLTKQIAKVKKNSTKASIGEVVNSRSVAKPSIKRIVKTEKPPVEKILSVKNRVSQKNSVIDLKKTSANGKKVEKMFQPKKVSRPSLISSNKNTVKNPAFRDSLLSEKLVIRENKVDMLNENTPKRKMALLFFVVVIFIGLFNLVVRYKYNSPKIVTEEIATEVANKMATNETVAPDAALPQNENPMVVTIIDGEKFSAKHFFSQAKKGDRVLIYTQANLAILYRPQTHKIVESINLAQPGKDQGLNFSILAVEKVLADENSSGNQASGTSVQSPVTVAVYNGSKTKGLAASLADRLITINGVKVVKKSNAVGNFEKTVVVDLNGKNADVAKVIAQAVGGEVAQLPASEKAPAADILVIGADEGEPQLVQ